MATFELCWDGVLGNYMFQILSGDTIAGKPLPKTIIIFAKPRMAEGRPEGLEL